MNEPHGTYATDTAPTNREVEHALIKLIICPAVDDRLRRKK